MPNFRMLLYESCWVKDVISTSGQLHRHEHFNASIWQQPKILQYIYFTMLYQLRKLYARKCRKTKATITCYSASCTSYKLPDNMTTERYKCCAKLPDILTSRGTVISQNGQASVLIISKNTIFSYVTLVAFKNCIHR